jgi:hypothetical protein
MKKLHSPNSEAELVIIRSLLDGEGFRYFVPNDHFGTLKTGPKITLLNEKTILVSEDHFEQASELISDYLNSVKSDTLKSEYTLIDKIRMIIETILFNWFIPGKKWGRNSD